jgi:hypothetical protein
VANDQLAPLTLRMIRIVEDVRKRICENRQRLGKRDAVILEVLGCLLGLTAGRSPAGRNANRQVQRLSDGQIGN